MARPLPRVPASADIREITVTAPFRRDTRTYWHRDLPPLDAEPLGEHTLEATSAPIPGTLAHRDELWDRCYTDLMAKANERLRQEIRRLGGHYAHVHDEAISPRHDHATGEAWLHGSFTYALYSQPRKP